MQGRWNGVVHLGGRRAQVRGTPSACINCCHAPEQEDCTHPHNSNPTPHPSGETIFLLQGESSLSKDQIKKRKQKDGTSSSFLGWPLERSCVEKHSVGPSRWSFQPAPGRRTLPHQNIQLQTAKDTCTQKQRGPENQKKKKKSATINQQYTDPRTERETNPKQHESNHIGVKNEAEKTIQVQEEPHHLPMALPFAKTGSATECR